MSSPVISLAQMRSWEEATWSAGQTEAEVIRQVGKAVAHRALSLTHTGDRILVLAGKGHNGDDARAATEHLPDRKVELLEIADPVCGLDQLNAALAARVALIVDGLFGIGLNRPLDSSWVRIIQRVNAARACVLSIDVPSGINVENGSPEGAAVEATITLTVGAPKLGLLGESAVPFVGRIEVAAAVGLIPYPAQSDVYWTQPEDFGAYPPPRPIQGHKGTFGHLAIVAGSLGFHGAAVLCARGAQRAQPGLITVLTLEEAYPAVAAQLQSPMVAPCREDGSLPNHWSALVFGPGLASSTVPEALKSSLRSLWRISTSPLVADASALDWLPPGPFPAAALRVLTPHPGEAARLLNTTVAKVQADRLSALRRLSERFNHAWIVLKGHQTLVGRSGGPLYVNPSGNPHLAQGGSGDLLAGLIGGLLAQPALAANPLQALRYAVWLHGAAADHLQATRPHWAVEDLIEALGRELPRESTPTR